MVSSSVRGVVQTFVAMGVFGELVSSKRWLGILFTLIGSALYTWVRHQEGEAEKLAKGKHEYELAATKDDEDVETLYESNSVDEKTKELILDVEETEDEIRIMKQTEALLSESTGKSR